MGRDKCVIKREKETDFGFGAQVGMSAVSHLKFVSRDWHGRIAGNSDRALSGTPEWLLLVTTLTISTEHQDKFFLPRTPHCDISKPYFTIEVFLVFLDLLSLSSYHLR